MAQAADRRQDGATSTPPSLPAPSWRRDSSKKPVSDEIRRLPPGTFPIDELVVLPDRRARERPALVMVLAPLLGLGIWAAIIALLF